MEQNKAEGEGVAYIWNLYRTWPGKGKESNLAPVSAQKGEGEERVGRTWPRLFSENSTTLPSLPYIPAVPNGPLSANSTAISFPVRSFSTNLRLEMSELSSKNSTEQRRKKPSARRVNDWPTKLPDAFPDSFSPLASIMFVNRGSENEIELSFELCEYKRNYISFDNFSSFVRGLVDELMWFLGCGVRSSSSQKGLFFAKFVIWMDIKCAFRNATILSSVRRYYESNFRFNKVGYELVARVPLAVRGTIKSRSKQCNFDSNCKLA